MQISWAGEALVLLQSKAVYWPSTGSLIVTDPHFGKTATFRSRGIPLPPGTTDDDLQRLSATMYEVEAKRLVVLGDFFHAKQGRDELTLAALDRWRAKHAEVEMHLVPGNHDRHAGAPPERLGFTLHKRDMCDGPFCFSHYPNDHPDLHVLSGHVHPAISLRDVDYATMKIPCFWFQERVALLPAFGGFTGTAVVSPQPGDRVFAIGPEEIIEVPTKLAAV